MAEWFALNVITAATISATTARPRGTVQYRSLGTGTDDGALTRDFFHWGRGTGEGELLKSTRDEISIRSPFDKLRDRRSLLDHRNRHIPVVE
jgi:hypothetical protein